MISTLQNSFQVFLYERQYVSTFQLRILHLRIKILVLGENQTELETDAYKAFLSSGEGILGFDKRQADKLYD